MAENKGLKFEITQDTLSPALKRIATQVPVGSGSRKILASMATALQSWVVQSFSDAAKRIMAWPDRRRYYKGRGWVTEPSNLQLSTKLRQSIRVRETTPTRAVIATDAAYAAAHQFGYPRRNLPPRPYFPVSQGGNLSPASEKSVAAAGQAALDAELRKAAK